MNEMRVRPQDNEEDKPQTKKYNSTQSGDTRNS